MKKNKEKKQRDYKARLVIYGLGKDLKSKDLVNWLRNEAKMIEDDYNDYSSTMVILKLMK